MRPQKSLMPAPHTRALEVLLECDNDPVPWLAIPLLGIHPRKRKTAIQTKACTQMFEAALSMTTNKETPPRGPLTDESTKRGLFIKWNIIQLYKGTEY